MLFEGVRRDKKPAFWQRGAFSGFDLKHFNVGIGTTNPGTVLDIRAGSTLSAIKVTQDSEGAYVGLDINNPTGRTLLLRTDGNAYADGVWTGPADYAEWFETNDTDLDKAELVSIDSANPRFVKRAAKGDEHQLIGVISTKPGIIGTVADDVTDDATEREKNPRWKIVGLLGQVPTKVSMENGPIQIGDPITVSSVPGVGMKAIKAGKVIGFALEPYSGEGNGKIMVIVNAQNWVAPSEFEELRARLAKLESNL